MGKIHIRVTRESSPRKYFCILLGHREYRSENGVVRIEGLIETAIKIQANDSERIPAGANEILESVRRQRQCTYIPTGPIRGVCNETCIKRGRGAIYANEMIHC